MAMVRIVVVVVVGLALMFATRHGDPQIDKPTPPDRYDHVEREMWGVHPGLRMWDVITSIGKPDYAAPFSYGQVSGPHGLRVYRVRCLTYVGYHTWQLCFDNLQDTSTFRLASKRRV